MPCSEKPLTKHKIPDLTAISEQQKQQKCISVCQNLLRKTADSQTQKLLRHLFIDCWKNITGTPLKAEVLALDSMVF